MGYSCTDPDAICVNDDDGDTSYATVYGSTSPWLSDDSSPSWVYDDYYVDDSLGLGTCIILFVNDSYCDLTNNNEACGACWMVPPQLPLVFPVVRCVCAELRCYTTLFGDSLEAAADVFLSAFPCEAETPDANMNNLCRPS